MAGDGGGVGTVSADTAGTVGLDCDDVAGGGGTLTDDVVVPTNLATLSCRAAPDFAEGFRLATDVGNRFDGGETDREDATTVGTFRRSEPQPLQRM